MQTGKLFQQLVTAHRAGEKLFAVLIDPDKADDRSLGRTLALAEKSGADLFLVGGSRVPNGHTETAVKVLKANSKIPVILFPGDNNQLTAAADALLFLTLISGRNPEYLIEQQVAAARWVKEHDMETIPTGYLLIDGGNSSSVGRVTGTAPIAHDADELAARTALAGQLLGLQATYLEAGSGAQQHVSESMVQAVRNEVRGPLFVGGGIRTPEQATAVGRAGADVLVVGNAIEKDAGLIAGLSEAIHSITKTTV